MPARLGYEEYGDALGDAWTVLRDNAARAGLDAPVPTCPGWTVRDLVAHTGMVHRWAAEIVRGRRDDQAADRYEQEGLASPDLLTWFDDGARDLLDAFAFAPVGADLWMFLQDVDDPRTAWCRRQAHETTVHAVDAMSAATGSVPAARSTWIRSGLAVDGIDELLLGFVPRAKTAAALPFPRRLLVRASDTGDAWTVCVADRRLVAHTGEPVPADGDAPVVEIEGTAAELYLGLWNRGDQLRCSETGFAEAWRDEVNVTW